MSETCKITDGSADVEAVRGLPAETIDHILSFIPPSDTTTLSTLLRVSKLVCQIAAPRLYRNICITGRENILVDTGLPAEVLGDSCGGTAGGEKIDADTESPGRKKTLKEVFLSFVKTVDIFPTSADTSPTDMSGTSIGGQDAAVSAPDSGPAVLSPPGLTGLTPPPQVRCDVLRLRLDTSSYQRYAPVFSSSTDDRPAAELSANIRPRRLVLHGAGFHQGASPIANLPPTLHDELREIIIVVTPGATVQAGDMLSMNHGLPFILGCLIQALQPSPSSSAATTVSEPVNITFILQTPRPGARFPLLDPTPHNSIAMTMDWHPDYAPGYLHPLTTLLGQRLLLARTAEGGGQVGEVSFVNFGALDGEQVGMPQAAMEEMQDRFEKGVRVRLSRAGVRDEKQGLRMLGMRDWLEEEEAGEGRGKGEGVVDEDILRGWRLM
ncbi:uncharacterized protein MKK02DRAFT_45137 [Dioszegia hungarica]|uniref:F-box domain-containing protein n=1 Tax=Dioszegia hungarica TaxID=4972 RepID=A0AA38H924_9TREE|nr:uncharacterized protein MKK02DRAFT_45137 [Dioszegia hungarica]KAI9636430.1 hypothetical protein MKK02DRAFT_45137 [Dioszegia hungarica]